MQLFYKLVLYISIIILILTLGLIVLNHNSKPDVFPQYVSKCPDYWIQNENGTCSVIVGGSGNTASVNSLSTNYQYQKDRKLGNIKVTPPCELNKNYSPNKLTYTFDFNGNSWCGNRKWAQTNDIFWEGVTNVRLPNLSC